MYASNIRFLSNLVTKSCRKCNSLKPPASHHCSICKRCIARMDHHCPWVNTCVGYYNQKFFLQFLIYVFLGSIHALVLICIRGFTCLDKHCLLFDHFSTIIIAAISAFLALLFGLFVLIMFCDQIQCIIGNTSTIDKLKKERQLGDDERSEKSQKRTWWQNIEEVFGSKLNIWWLFPTDVPRKLIFEREYD